jgi:hypothetical protein
MSKQSKPRSASNQLEVDQPIRAADRNQDLARSSDRTSKGLFLPSLGSGLTLLDVEGSRGVPILQSVVLDRLLMSDGPAFWVDAKGHATTASLAQLSPSQRLLDRIHVARGFTAYQHFGALCDLPTAVNRSIQQSAATDSLVAGRQERRERPDHEQEGSLHTPALIVAPALDVMYRTDDTLSDAHAETLQARALARLRDYAEAYDVPVLLSRTVDDEFTAPFETIVDQHLECVQTDLGPRFVGDEFETLVYPVGDGTYYQTTFAYWREMLAARADQVGLEPATQPQQTDVGTGVTVDGSTASLTTDPLLDAWTGAASAGGW